MKLQVGALMVAMLVSGAAMADSTIDIQVLADRSGLSARQVRMVLGAPVSFVEYRTSYVRSQTKLRNTIGKEQLEELTRLYKAELQNSVATNF